MAARGWTSEEGYDAIVVGSGFGGAMAAHVLVGAGWSVLMLERGDWVSRGAENWAANAVGPLTEHYVTESPYRLAGAGREATIGAFHCVGGPSVFYGGVALRFRAEDFEHDPEISGASGARWPWAYGELESYYAEAERLLGVSGESGIDPTEPARSAPYAAAPRPLAAISERIARAAGELGCRPFRLPLAINQSRLNGRQPCTGCGTCDGFACAVSAKNDVATVLVEPLVRRGLRLRTNAVVTRLIAAEGHLTGVEVTDRLTGIKEVIGAAAVVLAAGALATPHLLLASGLQRCNPGGHVIGRYLMRHYNAIVFGVFPTPPNPGGGFHKQLAIHDYYHGIPGLRTVQGKLGGLQQLATPPAGLVRAQLPAPFGGVCAPWVDRMTGLLAIAEDQPQYHNRVLLDGGAADRHGLPALRIDHHYSVRDVAAGRVLTDRARAILGRAGAWAFYRHRIDTFSHALGTVRMGVDPRTSALDGDGHFRGLDNLWIADASALPSSAGVNPSLTVAANALRTAHRLVYEVAHRTEPARHVALSH